MQRSVTFSGSWIAWEESSELFELADDILVPLAKLRTSVCRFRDFFRPLLTLDGDLGGALLLSGENAAVHVSQWLLPCMHPSQQYLLKLALAQVRWHLTHLMVALCESLIRCMVMQFRERGGSLSALLWCASKGSWQQVWSCAYNWTT